MREVIFHRLAGQELIAASRWYATRSETVHQRFLRAVDNAVERIGADPETHAKLFGPYRYAFVRRFSYLLVFESKSDKAIFIVAVAHASRKPGYWRKRTF